MKKRSRECSECEIADAVDKLLNHYLDLHYKDADIDKARLDRRDALSFLMGNMVQVYMAPEDVRKMTVQFPKRLDNPTYELLYTVIEFLEKHE